ncbi:MAG: L-lactate permease [Rhodocyclaceae bacterium]|nr:L-lactate permease [Rhodocyclaceae bacterium]
MATSTALAAVPVLVMLGALGVFHIRAHLAALLGLAAALLIAVSVYAMPADLALRSAAFGALNGLFPIGWIVLNILFLYRLAEESGSLTLLQRAIGGITPDRRLQLLLIAFSLGAFFEGAAGFGTPVAVTAALLISIGFTPLAASGLSLLANTAPVAFGALGTPVLTLAKVHGYDPLLVAAMIGRQLPVFSLLVPFWLVWVFAGRRAMWEVWPAIVVCGLSFAVPQFLVSNFVGPELVDIVAAVCSVAALVAFLRVWRPARVWTRAGLPFEVIEGEGQAKGADAGSGEAADRAALVRAWAPWAILVLLVFVWGQPALKSALNEVFAPKFPVAGLDGAIGKVPPVVAQQTGIAAVFTLNLLSATGSGILLAALLGGAILGFGPLALLRAYLRNLWALRTSLLTILLMVGLGTLTHFSGMDSTLGLAFAATGAFYPFFGTLMGWLGVALTGSDTASNVLFGGMQKVAAEQLGLSANLMGAANSSGGVMGKMIDAQSIVVASTATRWIGHEGAILRFVLPHSIALAALVGVWVTLQAYVWPFTLMVVR